MQHYCPNCYADSMYAPHSKNNAWPKQVRYECGAVGIMEITGRVPLWIKPCKRPQREPEGFNPFSIDFKQFHFKVDPNYVQSYSNKTPY